MSILSFIIPFRSPETTNNWKKVSSDCVNTISSILQQTDQDFDVYLVCNQEPEGLPASSHINVITNNFSVPTTLSEMRRDQKSKIKKALVEIRNKGEANHITLNSKSFLKNEGFFLSYYYSIPQDKKGNLLPWMNYSLIYFLKRKLNSQIRLFEYGSGSSTVFYSKLVKEIYSLEHDKDFFNFIKQYPLKNLILEEDQTKYPQKILDFEYLFDVIVIDGIKRCQCLDYALKKLSPTGVIIFDDTDRKSYWKKIEPLLEENFKELTFVGIKPGEVALAQTTILYREDNCLNI